MNLIDNLLSEDLKIIYVRTERSTKDLMYAFRKSYLMKVFDMTEDELNKWLISDYSRWGTKFLIYKAIDDGEIFYKVSVDR